MTKLRFVSGGLVGLFCLALLAAWLVPPLLDWNRYRDNIAVLASAVLGRPLTIAGRITLTLLPEPTLTAADVTVGGALAGTARELRLRVALVPLLSGTVAARELVLRRPDIHIAWPLSPGATSSFHRPPWLASVSARIEGGTLSIGDLRCSNIDATLSAGGDNAGAAAAGTAQCDNRDWRFTAQATSSGTDGIEGLDLSLDGQGPTLGLGAAFTGQLSADGTLSGQISGRGPDLSQLLPAPSVPFRGSGRLTLAAGLAAADDLELEIGGSPAHGAVTLRVAPEPRLDVALAASRLDLDAWLPVLLRPTAFARSGVTAVGLDLSAEAVQFRGGLLRRLRADFVFAPDGEAEIREVAAVLPGDATLHLAGRITRPGTQPHFAGPFSLEAPDLRNTLRWLDASGAGPPGGLPPDVLHTADLAGSVTAQAGELTVADLRGTVDGSGIGGELVLGLGGRLALAARLAVDSLPLDAWLGGPAPALADVPDRLSAFDADLQLTSPHARWRGATLTDFTLDAAASGGRLTVRRLAFLARGVVAQLSGTIGDGGRITGGRMSLATGDAAPLGELLPAFWRMPSLWQGPCRVEVQADGAPQSLGLRIGVDLADARLEAQPLLDLSKQSWSGSVTLRHPGAPRLLQRLGLARAGWIGDGSLSLVAQFTGAPGRLTADKFELGAGALHASGQVTLQQGEKPRLAGRIAAEILPLPRLDPRSGDPVSLDLLRGWQVALAVTAAHVVTQAGPLLDDASASLGVADGKLRLDDLVATLAARRISGGKLTGAATLDSTAEPPAATLRGTIGGAAIFEPLTGLGLDLVAGRLDGSSDLTAGGHSPAALLATLAGRIRLAATNGAVAGFDLSQADDALAKDASDAALRQALAGGSTGFDRFELDGTLERGNLTIGAATMAGPSGTAAFLGGIDAAGASVDLHATLHPSLPQSPALGLWLSGPWSAARRIPELADVARWRGLQAAK